MKLSVSARFVSERNQTVAEFAADLRSQMKCERTVEIVCLLESGFEVAHLCYETALPKIGEFGVVAIRRLSEIEIARNAASRFDEFRDAEIVISE